MEQDSELLTHLDAGVLWLTLNRPERRNALTHTLYEQLHEALEQAACDEAVGAIVLSGAGTAFCAGGDVARMHAQTVDANSTPTDRIAAMRRRTRVVELLHEMPKPTIAMIRGAAVGAGLSLALACDLRYADDSALMRTGFLNAGVSGDFGVHYFLPRIVGAARARELCLRSPKLSGQQAGEVGLIHGLFPAEHLLREVAQIAQCLAGGPQPAVRNILMNLNDGLHSSLSEMLDQECVRHVQCTASADHREAARAFIEKRPPVFSAVRQTTTARQPGAGRAQAGQDASLQSNNQETQ